MSKRYDDYDYTCKNEECEHEFTLRFYAATPNRGMHGRFEDAEQGDPAWTDPEHCPKCGYDVDIEEVEACL